MKLFAKIFLWFLAAIALMVCVVIFVTRTFQTEPSFSRWQRGARNQITVYAATGAQIFDSEGESGLRTFLGRLGDVETIREVDLVGIDGQVWFGDGTALGDFDPVKSKMFTNGATEIDVNSTETPLGAAPVNFKDGRRFALLVRWETLRAPSMFFDSWLGYLRLIGLFITAVIVCLALAKYLTSPISKIREATQALAAGDLSSRVAVRLGIRRDELADLARDFDVMAERIESLITSQQRLTRDISHELRSPLARLNVALEIAKQKSSPETAPILNRIEGESTRLNEMIERLLLLAKLESGSDEIEATRIELSELVKEVAEDADFEARAKGRSVKVLSDDECSVRGSENLLRSAIENVLRNAVRYTPEGTSVNVSLSAKNGKAVLQVSDHGGGVPDDELANLFRPFYRVGESRDRTTGGSGLGLAIAERAIKAHKGTITAQNLNGGLMVEINLNRDR